MYASAGSRVVFCGVLRPNEVFDEVLFAEDFVAKELKLCELVLVNTQENRSGLRKIVPVGLRSFLARRSLLAMKLSHFECR